MSDSKETRKLIEEIAANQQSMHEDMAALVDRMSSLEQAVLDHVKHTPEPQAINEQQQYLAARSIVAETGRASTSMLQRVLRIGYSRAAGLMDKLEENKVIGPADGSRPREVFLDASKLEELEDEESESESVFSKIEIPEDDDLYEDAKKAVTEAGKASVSYLQRKLRIGYTRAMGLIGMLEREGVVGPQDGSKSREVLIDG